MARLAARSRVFAASSHLVVHVVRLRVAIQAVEAILGDLLLAPLLIGFGFGFGFGLGVVEAKGRVRAKARGQRQRQR